MNAPTPPLFTLRVLLLCPVPILSGRSRRGKGGSSCATTQSRLGGCQFVEVDQLRADSRGSQHEVDQIKTQSETVPKPYRNPIGRDRTDCIMMPNMRVGATVTIQRRSGRLCAVAAGLLTEHRWIRRASLSLSV